MTMAFKNIEEFKELLESDPNVAISEMLALEASMRRGPPSDLKKAHETWKLILQADQLCRAKTEASMDLGKEIEPVAVQAPPEPPALADVAKSAKKKSVG